MKIQPKKIRPRRGQAGFSILEAIIAAAVLGIGLMGLVKLHSSSMHGISKSKDTSDATEVARQIANRVATGDVLVMQACTGAPLPPPAGCRNSAGPGLVMTPDKGTCTTWVQDAQVFDPVTGTPPAPVCPPASASCPGAFRIDRAMSPHPDGANHPNGQLLDVWVCWHDANGMVSEVHTSRIVSGVMAPTVRI